MCESESPATRCRAQSVLAHPSDDAATEPQATERFLVELRHAPPGLTVRDLGSDELILELDEEASERLVRRGGGKLADGQSRLAEALASVPGLLGGHRAPPSRNAAASAAPWEQGRAPLKKTRRRLWDLPANLHCPIIGTCLDVEELRRLAQKARCRYDGTLSDYEVHVSFVSSAGDKNALSLAAQKALEKRYAVQVRRFARAKTAAQLAALWNEALAAGEVPGGFWATLTHPKCDEPLRQRVREEVHMLSHQIGAGQRADLKRLAQTQAELAQLKHEFDALFRRSRQQLEERDQRILELEARLRTVEQRHRHSLGEAQRLGTELSALRRHHTHEHLSALERRVADQERRGAQLVRERDQWRHACEAAERRAEALVADHRAKCLECEELERLIASSITTCQNCAAEDCADCLDLGGRRILCVGGRQQLVDQYRALVTRCNGRFDHHDGGLEDSRQRLEPKLASADAVVCTTDCVSHDAYYRLKRFCKRYAKPCVLLRSSGVSTFARALETVAG